MNYREILKKRTKVREHIEDLKVERDLNERDYTIHKTIEREMFKYKIFNQMLKEKKNGQDPSRIN